MKTFSLFAFAGSGGGRTTALSLAIFMCGCSSWAAPFVPRDDAQILERVRVPSAAPAARELRELRAKLALDSQNLDLALALANRCIARARAEADPRYLGHAEAALGHWSNLAQPPAPVLVVRATIRQSNHDFERALADLELAVKLDPRNAQAWLTRASIFQVQGKYPQAKRACLPLLRLTSELIAVTCASSVASLNGEAEKSYELLNRVVPRASSASREEKLWAATALAEMAGRLGRMTEAEQHFRTALALNAHDVYLLGAFADFLLDQSRAAEVVDLLGDKTRIDGLLLRLTLAERMGGIEPRAEGHIAMLRERFAATRLRGDSVHQREEARFTLHLLKQPVEAVRLALANWQVQREPADLRILLEAAMAADDVEATQQVHAWLQQTKLEDVHVTELLASLNSRQKTSTASRGQHAQ